MLIGRQPGVNEANKSVPSRRESRVEPRFFVKNRPYRVRYILCRDGFLMAVRKGSMPEAFAHPESTSPPSLEEIVALCKRRGFVFPTSEIYGGLANSYDYGPM